MGQDLLLKVLPAHSQLLAISQLWRDEGPLRLGRGEVEGDSARDESVPCISVRLDHHHLFQHLVVRVELGEQRQYIVRIWSSASARADRVFASRDSPWHRRTGA